MFNYLGRNAIPVVKEAVTEAAKNTALTVTTVVAIREGLLKADQAFEIIQAHLERNKNPETDKRNNQVNNQKEYEQINNKNIDNEDQNNQNRLNPF